MWLEERRLERRHKLRQIRANARPRPLDKVRAGFICLGFALVLFAGMGWLAAMSAIIGVIACVGIYGIVSRMARHRDAGGGVRAEPEDGEQS